MNEDSNIGQAAVVRMNRLITVQQIAAILECDLAVNHSTALALATGCVQRALDSDLRHVARYIAAEDVWRTAVCDVAGKRSFVTDADPHTRIKMLADVAAVDLELTRVYEDRADSHELVRARVHLKNHQDDLKTRTGTLGDKLTAFKGAHL